MERKAKSAFVNGPPDPKSISLCCFSCFLLIINMTDVFSTLIGLWHSYTVDSYYKEIFTFFTVSYHGL